MQVIRGIHHTAIHTRNFDRMLTFYTAALGFEPVGTPLEWRDSPLVDQAIGLRNSAAKTIMLKAGNCYLEIFEYASPSPRDGEPLLPSDKGYTHFCLDVVDIEYEYNRLSAMGMTFGHNKPSDFGGIKAVYGCDPDGNIIELQELAPDQIINLSNLGQ